MTRSTTDFVSQNEDSLPLHGYAQVQAASTPGPGVSHHHARPQHVVPYAHRSDSRARVCARKKYQL